MIRRTVNFSGRVQGVGFRLTTTQIASGYRVSGYVKNLSDGRVEAVVEGEPPDVERFLNAVAAEMSPNIRETSWNDSAATREFSRFEIRR